MFFLAGFYFIVDVKQKQRFFFPLIVIGTNSIVAYVMAETIVSFIDSSFRINVSQNYDQLFGQNYQPLVRGAIILLVEWAILYWLYVRKIFIRI